MQNNNSQMEHLLSSSTIEVLVNVALPHVLEYGLCIVYQSSGISYRQVSNVEKTQKATNFFEGQD